MSLRPLSIAIVDDQEVMRDAARSFVGMCGYAIQLEAVNGQDLLSQLEKTQTQPDICLLDINMPEMDGYQTARVLRARFPQIRILAYSMSATPAQIQDIRDCGAHGFLPKEGSAQRWRQELEAVAI